MRMPDAFDMQDAEDNPVPSKELVLRIEKFDAETDKALGVKNTKDVMQWFPKSQVHYRVSTGRKREIRLFVPEWLAKQKEDLEFEEE